MALTNSQHDAIMRTYDAIRTENRHIQNERYAQVTAACPEIAQIEDDIIGLSMQAAAEMLKNPDYKTAYRKKLSELADRKAACLAALGRPADYLEPVYTCPKCKDTGYIGQHKCACFTKKAIELVYHDSNLKNIITTENFDTFSYEWYDKKTPIPSIGLTPYNNMQNIVSICHRFVDEFDTTYDNLLLFGDTGVGKTFLSHCIARELLRSTHCVLYFSAYDLFDMMAANSFSRKDTGTDEELIYDCDLLIIDDLGTELTNSFVSSQLFLCLNERIMRRKSTIISTNLTLKNFSDTYSERTFSRIASNYQMISLIGKDIRIQKIFLGGN